MASSQEGEGSAGRSQSVVLVSVKELAKQPTVCVPERYIREDQEPPSLTKKTDFSTLLPTIDMEKMVSGEACDFEQEKFHSAFKEWGFIQLVNHGVCSSLMEKLKLEVEEFFNLPLEEKMKYKITAGDVNGFGVVVQSDDQKLDWGDRLFMIINPIHRRRMTHLLPPSLRETLESYFSELQKLAMQIIGFVAKGLKMEIGEIKEMFEDGMRAVRMTYYPPCPKPELVMGLTPHSDATFITILHQLNGVGGLEIKKHGLWIPLNILPHAFVVNVGDILEILSNGMYQSVEHRATVNAEKERMSIAVFFNPKFEAEIGPATSLINASNPPLFRRILMEQYVNDFFSRKLDGKLYLHHMMIKDLQ